MNARAEAGSGGIRLTFPGDVDMKQAHAEVMDRIERARPRLPEEVDRVRIFKSDPSALPVMMAAVVAPEGLGDEEQQRRTQDVVVDEIIPDKGRIRVTVNIFGRAAPVELEYWQAEKV